MSTSPLTVRAVEDGKPKCAICGQEIKDGDKIVWCASTLGFYAGPGAGNDREDNQNYMQDGDFGVSDDYVDDVVVHLGCLNPLLPHYQLQAVPTIDDPDEEEPSYPECLNERGCKYCTRYSCEHRMD